MNETKKNNYTQLNPKQIVAVFEKNNVYFKRELRMSVLRKVIEAKYIEEKIKLEKLRDESLNSISITDSIRINRLRNYRTLSEFQLENDFRYYNDKNLINLYLKLFWDNMSTYIRTLSNSDVIFEGLEKLEEQTVVIKSVCDYNRYFSKRILDEENYFDGIHLVDAVRHFNQTSLAVEIKKLSEKYVIDIPKYWTKKDLQLRLKKALKAKYELTPKMIENIDGSNVNKLKDLLEQHHIDSKLHITKTDMINIIIKNVDKNKVSEISRIEEAESVEINMEESKLKKEKKNTISEIVNDPVVVGQNADYEKLLTTIILNQETLIKYSIEISKNNVDERNFKFSKIFNIIIFVLIVVVAMIWIIYGIKTLF